MQIFSSFAALLLIALSVALLMTFGFALFIWLTIMATTISAYVILTRLWYRWRGKEDPHFSTHYEEFKSDAGRLQVIEVDYKDISEPKK